LGIAEDPFDRCGGAESFEPIGVVEAPVFSHTGILPSFGMTENPVTSGCIIVFLVT